MEPLLDPVDSLFAVSASGRMDSKSDQQALYGNRVHGVVVHNKHIGLIAIVSLNQAKL